MPTFVCPNCKKSVTLKDREWEKGALLEVTDALAGIDSRSQHSFANMRCPRCGARITIQEMQQGKLATKKTMSDEEAALIGKIVAGLVGLVLLWAVVWAGMQWILDRLLGGSIGPDFLRIPWLQITGACFLGVLLASFVIGTFVELLFRAARRGKISYTIPWVILGCAGQLAIPFAGALLGIVGGGVLGAYVAAFQFLCVWLLGWTLGLSFDWVSGPLILGPAAGALLLGLVGGFRRGIDKAMGHAVVGGFLGLILGIVATTSGWADLVLSPSLGISPPEVVAWLTNWALWPFFYTVLCGVIALAIVGGVGTAAVSPFLIPACLDVSADSKNKDQPLMKNAGWIPRLIGTAWVGLLVYWLCSGLV
jgi:hypothetical protein